MLWLKEKDFIIENILLFKEKDLAAMIQYIETMKRVEYITKEGKSKIILPEPVSSLETKFKSPTIVQLTSNLYSYCYTILSKLASSGNKSDFLIELNNLKYQEYLSWDVINKIVDTLDKDTLNNLLNNWIPDFHYFSTNILNHVEFEEKRKIDINELEDMKKTAQKLGIKSLGLEYTDLCEKIPLAEENTRVLTLSRKINKKLNSNT